MYLMYDQYLAIHHLFLNGLHTRSDQDDAGGGGNLPVPFLKINLIHNPKYAPSLKKRKLTQEAPENVIYFLSSDIF